MNAPRSSRTGRRLLLIVFSGMLALGGCTTSCVAGVVRSFNARAEVEPVVVQQARQDPLVQERVGEPLWLVTRDIDTKSGVFQSKTKLALCIVGPNGAYPAYAQATSWAGLPWKVKWTVLWEGPTPEERSAQALAEAFGKGDSTGLLAPAGALLGQLARTVGGPCDGYREANASAGG